MIELLQCHRPSMHVHVPSVLVIPSQGPFGERRVLANTSRAVRRSRGIRPPDGDHPSSSHRWSAPFEVTSRVVRRRLHVEPLSPALPRHLASREPSPPSRLAPTPFVTAGRPPRMGPPRHLLPRSRPLCPTSPRSPIRQDRPTRRAPSATTRCLLPPIRAGTRCPASPSEPSDPKTVRPEDQRPSSDPVASPVQLPARFPARAADRERVPFVSS